MTLALLLAVVGVGAATGAGTAPAAGPAAGGAPLHAAGATSQGTSPAPKVVLVADAPSRLVDDAKAGLERAGAVVEVRVLGDAGAPPLDGAGVVVLAAGPRSAAAVVAERARRAGLINDDDRRPTPPAAAAFLVRGADVPDGLAAVTLDASFASQLAWVKLAFPGRTRVIVPRSRTLDDAKLRTAADDAGLTLTLVDVRSAGEAVPAVEDALQRVGGPAVILLVPDPVAVTADTVAPLVQSALAARAPVVGFSTYFLKLGALAAVSVDAGDMARQALALALAPRDGAPRIEAPASAHLVVDGRLAERLGIAVRAGPGVEVRR